MDSSDSGPHGGAITFLEKKRPRVRETERGGCQDIQGDARGPEAEGRRGRMASRCCRDRSRAVMSDQSSLKSLG
jgi:hypothetical protein